MKRLGIFLSSSFLFCVPVFSGGYDPPTQTSATSQKRLREYAASAAKPSPKDFISGKCIVSQPKLSTVAIPCPSLEFRVLDAQGNELRRVLSQYGELIVRVEEKRDYFLALDSKKFRTNTERFGPLHAGESVLIEVHSLPPPSVSP